MTGTRWFNVNEDGEVYDSHPTESAARLVQAEFPNDVVVEASSAEEAERLAFPQADVNLAAPRKIQIEVTITNAFLADVLTIAVEGGINYWLEQAESIDRAADLSVTRVAAPLHLAEDDEPHTEDITLDTMALGIQRLVSGEVSVRDDLYAQVALGTTQNDAGEIDADAADCIVQAGLFGQIVYG